MPLEPRVVFENFSQYLARFAASSDAEVEDHLFDRKEIPLPTPGSNVSHNVLRDIKEQIRETVSAFANTNPEGGLLVIGISKTGCLVGITQHRGDPDARLMGYANVFNRYGRWLFYSGNVQTFAYAERGRRLSELVESTLRRVEDLSETPHVYFHYSARFSREDRDALVAAARRVRPNGTYSFVWINSHHPVRLYDSRPESDGSLARGTYVVTAENQLYISTTGYNPYRKMLGTPLRLEVTVWTFPPAGRTRTPADLHALARQILALTKLNWSSSDALTGEPITTKYAGDIAYLTAAFMRQGATFALHPALERTPWFL